MNHLFAVGALWWLGTIFFDAVVALLAIFARWNMWERIMPLIVLGLVVCPAMTYLVACAAYEYFGPLPDRAVAKVRRWIGIFDKFLELLSGVISGKRVQTEKKL